MPDDIAALGSGSAHRLARLAQGPPCAALRKHADNTHTHTDPPTPTPTHTSAWQLKRYREPAIAPVPSRANGGILQFLSRPRGRATVRLSAIWGWV